MRRGPGPTRRLMAAVALGTALGAAAGGCAILRTPGLGVTDAETAAQLSLFRIAYARPDGVYLARGDGSGERRLAGAGDLGRGAVPFMASLSPDRRHVLFLELSGMDPRRDRGTGLSLHILHLEEDRVAGRHRTQLERLIGEGAADRLEAAMVPGAAWSADSSRIAVGLRREHAGAADVLVVLDASGTPLRMIEPGGRRLVPASGLSWDGTEGLFVALRPGEAGGAGDTGEETGTLMRVGLAGAPGTRIVLEALADGSNPAVSPDGSRLAMVEARPGALPGIVLLDRRGGELDRYDSLPGRALNHPFWSPDGRFLYYHSLASTGPLGLLQVGLLRCLDTRGGRVFDLVRLG